MRKVIAVLMLSALRPENLLDRFHNTDACLCVT